MTVEKGVNKMQGKRALLSVWDKTGIVPFAQELVALGLEIVSSGGTSTALREADVPHLEVSEVTGFAEILGGRVKTLHPMIHGGILANLNEDKHRQQLEELSIRPFAVVAVNLYPFRATVADPNVTEAEAVEKIDIGGSALIRASAKNHAHVAVITSPEQYGKVVAEIKAEGQVAELTRKQLAVAAFCHSAAYDASIAAFFQSKAGMDIFPVEQAIGLGKLQSLRYGENPGQEAAFYRVEDGPARGLAAATMIQGKELSYNNILDIDAAIGLAGDLGPEAAVVVKHTNPSGAAKLPDLATSYLAARDADALSAYGGVVALHGTITDKIAGLLAETFIEVVAATGLDESAKAILAKKADMRVLILPEFAANTCNYRSVYGGVLVQSADSGTANKDGWEIKTSHTLAEKTLQDLEFAQTVGKHVKSNAIVIVKDNVTVGVGAGQMSRVESVRIALSKAGEAARGAVAASDAFFPFADGIELFVGRGLTAIIEPGGSIRDDEVAAAAEKDGIALVFSGRRHFRH